MASVDRADSYNEPKTGSTFAEGGVRCFMLLHGSLEGSFKRSSSLEGSFKRSCLEGSFKRSSLEEPSCKELLIRSSL